VKDKELLIDFSEKIRALKGSGCGCDSGCGCNSGNESYDEQVCDCENCVDEACSCSCHQASADHAGDHSFDNPQDAMKMAKKLGFDKIHNHKVDDQKVFMPGPSHEALMKKLKELK